MMHTLSFEVSLNTSPEVKLRDNYQELVKYYGSETEFTQFVTDQLDSIIKAFKKYTNSPSIEFNTFVAARLIEIQDLFKEGFYSNLMSGNKIPDHYVVKAEQYSKLLQLYIDEVLPEYSVIYYDEFNYQSMGDCLGYLIELFDKE